MRADPAGAMSRVLVELSLDIQFKNNSWYDRIGSYSSSYQQSETKGKGFTMGFTPHPALAGD
eukprot:6993996-Prymnesium_polylepis.1